MALQHFMLQRLNDIKTVTVLQRLTKMQLQNAHFRAVIWQNVTCNDDDGGTRPKRSNYKTGLKHSRVQET
jgi:hypothetical protein